MTDYGSREPRHAAPPKPPGPVALGLLTFACVAVMAPVWLLILGVSAWERLRRGPGRPGAYEGLIRVFVPGDRRES